MRRIFRREESFGKRFHIILALGIIFVGQLYLTSCRGRRADDMKPLGETVKVVIPEGDIAQDSALTHLEADAE